MTDTGTVNDIDPSQPPTSFWYLFTLVLLAPVQLSRHIQEVVSSQNRFKFILSFAWIQIVLILPSAIFISYLRANRVLMFSIGAVIGTLTISLLPILYINIVTRMSKVSRARLFEPFLRGVSRIWVFFWIGGLLGNLIGRPDWTIIEYVCSFGFGLASANAMSLMLVMEKIDILGYEKTRLILLEAHTARKLKPILFGSLSLFSILSHCLPYWLGFESSLLYPSLSSILIVVFAGLAIGSRYNLGWMYGTVASFVVTSKTVLRHDEFGVIAYSRLKNYLEGLCNLETPLSYYKEVAYFLLWSPWQNRIIKQFSEWLDEDAIHALDKVEKLLDLPVPELKIIIDNLSTTKFSDGSVVGVAVAMLKQILDTLDSGQYHLDLKLDIKSKQIWPETFNVWFSLMPQHFSNQISWSEEFQKKLSIIGGECDLEHAVTMGQIARPVINTILARFVLKQAELYFQPPLEIAPVLEWKQQTYYLRDHKAEIEVDIINTSQTPINLNEILISIASTSPVKFATNSHLYQKEWQTNPGSILDAGSAYTITLPIFCEKEQVKTELILEIGYAFRKDSGREIGYHESKVVRQGEFLLLKGRPFVTITPNPYSRYPVKSGKNLFGREKVVKELCTLLTATPSEADYVLITGERRLGKTSLLYVVADLLNNSGIPAIYCDAQHFNWDVEATGGDNVVGMLRWLADSYLITLGQNRKSEIESVKDFFTNFADIRVVFLVDEFDTYLHLLSREEIHFWESKPFHNTAISMVCSIPESSMRAQSTDWFNNFFGMHSFSMPPLSQKAANELITHPLRGWLDFEPGAVTMIMRYTGGFPIYLQAVCGTLVNYMNSKADNTVVTRDDIVNCLSDSPESISRLMASYICTLPESEIDLLKILAQKHNRLRRSEISGRSLAETVINMEQRGLLQVSESFVSCTAELLLSQDLLSLRSTM